MTLFRFLAATLILLPLPALAAPHLQVNAETGETQAQFAARTRWWREAKFGMFIHWGVYAVPADSSKSAAEWYMYGHQVPVAEYEKFAPQFNPVKFDAERWVRIAKDAGMKYIVITSKHHDGFCMFDTKQTDYNIVKATPFHRDPMKELAAACARNHITLCFYHSFMDWHHPDYLPRRPWDTRPVDGANLDRYVGYMEAQLRELLTNYGRIGVIWFDGGWEHNAQEEHSTEVVKLIRSLQPGILINDRLNLPEDFSTPEQTIPANALPNGRLWETCMTMNNTWGYSKTDHDWKSTEDLTRKLCDIASKGGNFLLNVGPTGEGEIPDASVERLAAIGRWMRVNHRSIYNTTQSPFRRLSFDGRCTVSGHSLFLQVFHWPEEGLSLQGLQPAVRSARALDGGERLVVAGEGDTLHISKPARIDPIATVVELKLASTPVVVQSVQALRPASDGALTLQAQDAQLDGGLQVEQKGGEPNVGYWTNAHDTVSWLIDLPMAGAYHVDVEYACDPGAAGSHYKVESGGQAVEGQVDDTGGWDQFRTVTLHGELTLPAGRHTLRVNPISMPSGAVMNLRRIVLHPLR